MFQSAKELLWLLLFFVTAPVITGWVVSALPRLSRFVPRRHCSGHREASLCRTLAMSQKGGDGEHPKLFVLGVCGGIGSGKSQACELLVSELGCVAHIDADTVAHVVYEPKSQALQEISKEFGDDVIGEDGEVDRKRLGAIVFSDSSAMSMLERIVWPHVKEEIRKRIVDLRKSDYDRTLVPVVVLEAAMLLDAGWEDLLDGLWVVTTPRLTALDRLINNRSLTKDEAQKRMDAQQSRRGIGNLAEEVSNGSVTACIRNDGTLEDLARSLQKALVDPESWKHPSVATTLKNCATAVSSVDSNTE